MAICFELSYPSRLARHRHILWTPDHDSESQVSIPEFQEALVRHIPVSSSKRKMAPLTYGRFYPAQIVNVSGEPPAGIFRVIGISRKEFTADFNHPLAGKETKLESVKLQTDISAMGNPHMLLEWAGIDAPLNDQDTDYSIPHAFDRDDPSDDEIFYENPRKVIHVDPTCVSRITALYTDLIRPEDTVLDLMSSWRSHLPAQSQRVTGLGMNLVEMADNPQLHSHLVQNLNRTPLLLFKDGAFDTVINTVSIEYLIEPYKVFSEVRRVLIPGGLVIVTFSNRYFQPKTTRLWMQLHPAERPGWVLQLLKKTGFTDLHCRVERGLCRLGDDRYTGRIEEMDPLFAVWGRAVAN